MLFISGLYVQAHQFEREKTIDKRFNATSKTEISISSKYGNIHVKNWDQAAVKFDINVKVKGVNVDKVNKIIRNIDISFQSSDSLIQSLTVFSSDKNKIFSDLSEFSKKGSQIHVDITVYAPTTNNLKIYNKHGNVYLPIREGIVDVTLIHGSLKADQLKGKTYLNLSSANASVIHLINGEAIAKKSHLNFRNSGRVSIDSEFSQVKVNKAKDLSLYSKRDQVYLGNIEKIKGETNYSYLQIDQLSNSLAMETKYGDLIVDKIVPSFKQFNLNSISTKIATIFDSKSTYEIVLDYNRKSNVYYSDSLSFYRMEVTGNNDDQYKMTGTYGIGGHLDSFVKITQKSGKVEIVNK